MFVLRTFETYLVVLEAIASAGLVLRFLFAGLHQTYRFFFVYLIVFSFQEAGVFLIPRGTNAYGWFFFITEGLIVVLYALITLELYSLVLRDLTGIGTIARRYIKVALAIAILVSILLLGMEQVPRSVLSRYFSFERPIVTSLVCFVFLITGFLVYYPVPLSRNVIFYTIGYAVYFASKAIALFLRNTGHNNWDRLLSLIMLGVSTACVIFWMFALTREGEKKDLILGHALSPDDEKRLLQQLQAINASLSRARK